VHTHARKKSLVYSRIMGLYETFYLFYGFLIRGIHIKELKKYVDENWLIKKYVGVQKSGEFDGEKIEMKKVGVIVHIPESMQKTGSRQFLFKQEKKIRVLPDEKFVQKVKKDLEKEFGNDIKIGTIPDKKKILDHKEEDVKKLKNLKDLYPDSTEIGIWTFYDTFYSGNMSIYVNRIKRVYTQEEYDLLN